MKPEVQGNTASVTVCPTCGRCPTCGKQQPAYPYYPPYVQPVYPNTYPYQPYTYPYYPTWLGYTSTAPFASTRYYYNVTQVP